MKLTISKITRNDKDKNGNPYRNKSGYPSVRVAIQTVEKPGVWLSCFDSRNDTGGWKDGDVIEVEIEEKRVGDNVYYNFRLPRVERVQASRDEYATKTQLQELKLEMDDFNSRLKTVEGGKINENGYNNVDDPNVPF